MRRALFFIVAVFCAATSFASIPRASMLNRASEDASAFVAPLSETRVWASEVLAPFERPPVSELSRALHQAYADSSTTSTSGLGRFSSVDPSMDLKKTIPNPQMWNRYSHVLNNPLRYTDPDGREHVQEPGFTKPLSEVGDWSKEPAVSWAFYAQGALLTLAAEEVGGGLYGIVRGLIRVARGPREEPTLRPDVKVSGGRSGQDAKTTTGPPNSIIRGSDGRIYQTNDKGQVIKDITKERVKPVEPGRGFGPKREPTKEELNWLEKMGQAIRDLLK